MNSHDIFISEPKPIKDFPKSDYIYAICQCEIPDIYAICIPREKGEKEHHFKCRKCGLEGVVYGGD